MTFIRGLNVFFYLLQTIDREMKNEEDTHLLSRPFDFPKKNRNRFHKAQVTTDKITVSRVKPFDIAIYTNPIFLLRPMKTDVTYEMDETNVSSRPIKKMPCSKQRNWRLFQDWLNHHPDLVQLIRD